MRKSRFKTLLGVIFVGLLIFAMTVWNMRPNAVEKTLRLLEECKQLDRIVAACEAINGFTWPDLDGMYSGKSSRRLANRRDKLADCAFSPGWLLSRE
jgi:hypothetical protein